MREIETQMFGLAPAVRRSGWLMVALAVIVAGAGVTMAFGLWAEYGALALIAGVVGLAASGLPGLIAVRTLWPQQLIVAAEGGSYTRKGQPALAWRWDDGTHLDWHRASTSAFVAEEPLLVLPGGERIALEPFGEPAFVAVRERLVVTELLNAT